MLQAETEESAAEAKQWGVVRGRLLLLAVAATYGTLGVTFKVRARLALPATPPLVNLPNHKVAPRGPVPPRARSVPLPAGPY